MGFDGKDLGKNGQGIHNPIEICIRTRTEGLGYEGNTSNGNIEFVKIKTSIEGEISTSICNSNEPRVEAAITNQVQRQKQEQCCNHCGRTGHVLAKC